MTIRILVIDDHALVRAGVRAELESSGADFDIVGEASDVEGAIAACHALTPDVALLDVHLPGGNGGGGAEVAASCADVEGLRFLALSVSDSPEDVVSNALPQEMLRSRRAWPVLFWMRLEGRVLPLPLTTMNWICCQLGSRKSCV